MIQNVTSLFFHLTFSAALLAAIIGCIWIYRVEPRQDELLLNRTWINEQKKSWVDGRGLSILMVGRSATGKSRLINWFLGRKEKKKMKLGQKKPAFVSETLTIKSVPLLLMSWSSPKLSDLNSTEIQTVKDFDLIVYTLKLDDARFQLEDITMMCNLVEIFGADFYKKAVFVLTNANKVGSLDKNNKHIMNKEIMETKKNEWRRVTIAKLKRMCGVKLESIPFVPAGHSDMKMLFGKHWPTEVLRAFLSQLEDVNYPAFVKICEQHLENA